MVDFTRRENLEVPFAGTGLGAPSVDKTTASIIDAAGGIAEKVVEFQDTAALRSFSERLDAVGVNTNNLSVLDDQTDIELSGNEKGTLNQFERSLRQLEILQEQGAKKTDLITRAVALTQSAINQRPRIAKEINAIFSAKFGRTAGQEFLALRENEEDSIKERRDAFEAGINETAKSLGFSTALPLRVKMTLISPFQDAQLRLAKLRQTREVLEEEQKIDSTLTDLHIAQSTPDVIATAASTIQGRIQNFDSDTADEQQREGILLALREDRAAALAALQATYPGLNGPQIVDKHRSTFDLYDNAEKLVLGTEKRQRIDDSNAILVGISQQEILGRPGVAEAQAKIELLQGVSRLAQGFPGIAGTAVGLRIFEGPAFDLLKGVTDDESPPPADEPRAPAFVPELSKTLLGKPNRDAYSRIEDALGVEAAKAHIRQFTWLVERNFDNDEAVPTLLDAMARYTNVMSLDPDSVPMDVYDSLLNITSKEQWLKLRSIDLSGGRLLSANLTSGFRVAFDGWKNDLASKMSGITSQPIVQDIVPDQSFVKIFPTLFAGELTEQEEAEARALGRQPRFGDLMEGTIASDGSLIFTPIGQGRGMPEVVNSARTLSNKHGVFFGKLARSHAHQVAGNTDYNTSANLLLESGIFSEALTTVPSTATEISKTPEAKEPKRRVRRYNPETRKFESIE